MRLIDADELKKLFPDNGEGSWTYNITAKMYIDNAPEVEERPTGRWILDTVTPHSVLWFRCSYCGNLLESYKETNYCPNCGANMNNKEDGNGK